MLHRFFKKLLIV